MMKCEWIYFCIASSPPGNSGRQSGLTAIVERSKTLLFWLDAAKAAEVIAVNVRKVIVIYLLIDIFLALKVEVYGKCEPYIGRLTGNLSGSEARKHPYYTNHFLINLRVDATNYFYIAY